MILFTKYCITYYNIVLHTTISTTNLLGDNVQNKELEGGRYKNSRTFIQTTTVKTTVHTEQKNTAVCYTHISSSFAFTDKQD